MGAPVLALVLVVRLGHAQQPLVWSPAGTAGSGGTGTWNTAGVVWSSGGVCCQTWNNAAVPPNDAVFGGTAGTVTVSGTINVRNLTFDTTGYVITGGTLALGGSTPTPSPRTRALPRPSAQ